MEAEAKAQAEQEKRAKAEAEAKAQREARERGVNPPCWYTVETKPGGGRREKAIYLLDIAVHDRHMVLGRREPPRGGPDDEEGDYRREFREIGAHRLPYGKRLGNTEVREALDGIAKLGKEAKIRSYSCISYVRVWDLTGRTAKHRWQDAHERLLQQYLGTYVVQDAPWPH